MASRLLFSPLSHSHSTAFHHEIRKSFANGNCRTASSSYSRLSVVANLDYHSSRPYNTEPVDPTIPSEPTGLENKTPNFWSYDAPKSYSSPASYGAPGSYGSPVQYGPKDEGLRSRAFELAQGGGGGEGKGPGDNNGNGGSGGGDDNEKQGDGESDGLGKDNLTQSQKITLVYAILITFGGLMGLIFRGSVKSLLTALASALVLIFVFAALPSKPLLASCVGFGVSATLFDQMSNRYWKTQKFFPAGFVAVISFIMSGGYVHGVVRSLNN